ncbi:class I SAM-dependent methyltransferase [Pontixanthobacter gangjinensis]|uniref:Methyltransferase domain-containing protein n=1 Tax=Christiangramia aestuarii TaxID=1028746 RepID=A0A7K1LS27_9FLAO|nr:methyltransferase domain-containing protein [Christiangramia aestuarii]MUP43614.1 methyltransferase domain-containing protein [Christiangramia aestuarii]
MKKHFYSILLCFLAFGFYQCKGQTETESEPYTYKSGSFDGIGKFYKGREIAHVMGYQGIGWLERPEREKEENTSRLIENMNIQPGDSIADIGAGSGYHVFKMAPLAGNGLVYAVDIQPEMLSEIEKKKKSSGQGNVRIIKGSEKSVNLPQNSVDKILMVDVYHEFSYPVEMLESMYKALRKNGRIYLIEYKGEDASIPIKKLHKMTETQAVKEFEANGFRLKENKDNLPWQHCMVFVKK